MRYSHSAALIVALLLPAWAIAQDPLPADAIPPLPDEIVESTDSPTDPGPGEDIEVLNRGPIHEAFADDVPGEVEPPPVVANKPPEPINEIPPEVKPDDDSIWVPGYFLWSDAEQDFIWVSGVWRVPPPGRQWTPGYWAEVDGGWQWIAGFWAEADAQQLNYLPYPPESLDTGPTSPAPAADYYWVNGCWLWNSDHYAWRPGYWNSYRSGWCWIPQRYVWSPRGVLFVGGYWDYPLARRGLLFAPIRYLRPIYHRPGYYYRPSYAVRPANILIHLFVNTRHRHLYYGNYYGSRFRDLGYRGWGHYEHRHSHLPSFTYYQNTFRRQGVDFGNRLDQWERYYDRKPEYRPARTVADARRQQERFNNERTFARESVFTTAATELANRRFNDGRESFRRTGDLDRNRFDRDQRDLSEIIQRRARTERPGESVARADRNGRLPGDRDQRTNVSRPTLDLPNFLSDADRRQRFESQMRELRERNLDRGSLANRGDARSRFGGNSLDRSEIMNRLNAARSNGSRTGADGRSLDRSDFFNRLNAGRSSADVDRGNAIRSDAIRSTSPFGSRDQRPSIDANQLRDRFQNRSNGNSPTNRFSPGNRSDNPIRSIGPQPSSPNRSSGSRLGANTPGSSSRTPSAGSPSRSIDTGRFFNRSNSGRSSSPSVSSPSRSSFGGFGRSGSGGSSSPRASVPSRSSVPRASSSGRSSSPRASSSGRSFGSSRASSPSSSSGRSSFGGRSSRGSPGGGSRFGGGGRMRGK